MKNMFQKNPKFYVLSFLIFVFGVTKTWAQKNVILILSDDHAYQAISAYKDRFANIAPTPNIDKLANGGIRFDRSYVGNSICAPSRATILTGKHSHKNGVIDLATKFNGHQQTLPKLLQKAGYETAIVGKWHLKTEPVGFSYWDVLIGQGDYYHSDFKNSKGVYRTDGYVTDVITDKAIQWLDKERNTKKPFMMIVGNKAPHANWLPPVKYLNTFKDVKIPEPSNLLDTYKNRSAAAKETDMTLAEMPLGWYCQLWTPKKGKKDRYLDEYGSLWKRAYGRLNPEEKAMMDATFNAENEAFKKANLAGADLVRWKYQRTMKNYLACVKSVDDNVGRLLAYVKANNLEDDTLIIYASDQGLFLGEHGWYDKRFMYEEAFRTPFIAYCPSEIPANQVSQNLVQNIDYTPTILDFAKTETPKDIQGVSLKPLMQGKRFKQDRKNLYYHYYEYPRGHSIQKHEGVVSKDFKLIHFYKIDQWEFFDLRKDPSEMKNEYNNKAYKKEIKKLKKAIIKLRATYNVPQNK